MSEIYIGANVMFLTTNKLNVACGNMDVLNFNYFAL